jgi:hypothetical protein
MLNRILPKTVDNNFRGWLVAIWLLAFYAFIKFIQGAESLFNTASTATGADGIPLRSLGSAAETTVLDLLAILGLNQLIFSLLLVLVLARYRTLIPLMYVVMLARYLAAQVVDLHFQGLSLSGELPIGFYVNLSLVAILVAGFGFSVVDRKLRKQHADEPTG